MNKIAGFACYILLTAGVPWMQVSVAAPEDPPAGEAHQHHAHSQDAVPSSNAVEPDSHEAHTHPPAKPETPPELGLAEKIGHQLPGNIVLKDEKDVPRTLSEIIVKPTILILVYYGCPTACPMIQANVAHALKGVSQRFGEDYQVISVSFDDEDTAADAASASRNYPAILGAGKPADGWRFFTADAHHIGRLTGAVGFHFKKVSDRNFVHPNLITILSAERQVIRYLYGDDFLPFDIGMALTEAQRNTPGVSIKKIVSYCFDYDPANKRYTFRLFRVFGVVTLATLGLVMFLLLRKGRTPRDKGFPPDTPVPRQ